MAIGRAQQGGTVTAGGIGPLLSAMLMEDKQARNQQLLQAASLKSAEGMQRRQISADQYMQTERLAAASAENDRAFAAQKASARLERQFRNEQRAIVEEGVTNRFNAQMEAEEARETKRLDLFETATSKHQEYLNQGQVLGFVDAHNNRLLLKNFGKAQGLSSSAKEIGIDQAHEAIKEAEEMGRAQAIISDEVSTKLLQNPAFSVDPSAFRPESNRAGALMQKLIKGEGGENTWREFGLAEGKALRSEGPEDLERMIDNRVWMSIDSLLPSMSVSQGVTTTSLLDRKNHPSFIKGVSSGKVTKKDIFTVGSILKGVEAAADARMAETGLSKDEVAHWRRIRGDATSRLNGLSLLDSDTTLLEGGSRGETVGSEVKKAMDWVRGTTPGNHYLRKAAAAGKMDVMGAYEASEDQFMTPADALRFFPEYADDEAMQQWSRNTSGRMLSAMGEGGTEMQAPAGVPDQFSGQGDAGISNLLGLQ
jgi:hypothetical protein